jgi:hypothetical protein
MHARWVQSVRLRLQLLLVFNGTVWCLVAPQLLKLCWMMLKNWIHYSGKADSWKKGHLLLSILTLLGILIVWRGYHFQVQVKVALALAIAFCNLLITHALALGSVTAA